VDIKYFVFPQENKDNFNAMNLCLQTLMPFGKYRGALISTIVQNDPEYVQWMLNNCKNYSFSSKLKEATRIQLWLSK